MRIMGLEFRRWLFRSLTACLRSSWRIAPSPVVRNRSLLRIVDHPRGKDVDAEAAPRSAVGPGGRTVPVAAIAFGDERLCVSLDPNPETPDVGQYAQCRAASARLFER